jgi:hypothetical protein
LYCVIQTRIGLYLERGDLFRTPHGGYHYVFPLVRYLLDQDFLVSLNFLIIERNFYNITIKHPYMRVEIYKLSPKLGV